VTRKRSFRCFGCRDVGVSALTVHLKGDLAMKQAWWMFGAAALLAVILVIAPMTVTMSRAQMAPGMGASLDQLSGDEFDKAFLSQMTMHHAMAVMMARPVLANATHPELKGLATSIIADQTREIGQMRGWARDWYSLEIPDPVAMMAQTPGQGAGMPGMHHPGMGAGMPMHQQQGNMPMMGDMSMMASLDKLPPQRLEAVFMSQMIPHHQSAIEMAGLVADRAAHPEVKDLAKGITTSQSAEIEQMNGWLSSWYGL
jgi:uncharacterized protein (DUF305 family)